MLEFASALNRRISSLVTGSKARREPIPPLSINGSITPAANQHIGAELRQSESAPSLIRINVRCASIRISIAMRACVRRHADASHPVHGTIKGYAVGADDPHDPLAEPMP